MLEEVTRYQKKKFAGAQHKAKAAAAVTAEKNEKKNKNIILNIVKRAVKYNT